MIIEVLFNLIMSLLKIVFFITQVLPDMPTPVTNVLTMVTDYAVQGAGFLHEILGKPLAVALFTILIVLIPFYTTWRMSVWIYTRIRG